MSKKDTLTKQYMQDARVFADAFNYLIYGGEQVIKPESLREMDTTAIVLPYGDDDKSETMQKYRDVLKMAIAMEDSEVAYMILGIENQSEIHYAMPVRNMLYDAIQYENQVTDAARSHKKAKNRGESKADFLSGFHKNDKLLPVITLVVYFGADEWDAPRSIHEMLFVKDKRILAYVPDYKANIIAPQELSAEELEKFRTDLRAVLKYIKYSKDKNVLDDEIQKDDLFRNLPRNTAELINAVTHSDIKFKHGEENVDMCEAIRDMRNDAFEEGKKEACKAIESMRNDAIQEGKAEGRAEGEEKGRYEEKIQTAKNMLADDMPHEIIAKYTKLSLEEIQKIADELTEK